MRQYYHACSVKSLFGFLIHTETGSSFMYSINWHCLWQRERNKIISINCRNIMLVKQRHLVLSCIWNSKTVFCTSIYYVKLQLYHSRLLCTCVWWKLNGFIIIGNGATNWRRSIYGHSWVSWYQTEAEGRRLYYTAQNSSHYECLLEFQEYLHL